MVRIAVVAAMLVFGSCKDDGDDGEEGADTSSAAKLHLSDVGEQKAGIEFAFNVEVKVDNKTVTTGDIANTGVTVQWKCGEEEYTDANKVEAEIKSGKVEVKIIIGKADDLEDKTNCEIRATAEIADEEVKIESPVFTVKAQSIKIFLEEGALLGGEISDIITGIKNDAGDVPLAKATVSIKEGCRDVKLIHWPKTETETNLPSELKSVAADTEDVYLASNKKTVDTNCLLVVSTDEGQKYGVVPLSDREADYSLVNVVRETTTMTISLREDVAKIYKAYLIYNSDDTRKKWYEPGKNNNLAMSGGTITLTLQDDPVPDGFYYKVADRLLFWVSEPTVIDEIVALENQGRKFSVRYVPASTTITLADKSTADSCAAKLYQVGDKVVTHPTVSDDGTEAFPGVMSFDRFDTVPNLFVIGDPANCVLKAGDENVVASFASEPEPSGVEVTVGKSTDGNDYIKVDIKLTKVTPKDSKIYVLDTNDDNKIYRLIDAPQAGTYTSNIASDDDDTALVKTDIDDITWLLRAQNKTAM